MGAVITDKAKLNAGMAATANAIRAKTGDSAPIPWDYENGTGFKAAVEAIPTGAQPVLEPLTITENGIYTPPEGVDGFSMVIAGVTVRSPRCDMVVTFDWGAEQTYMAWMDGTPEPRPEPEPGPEPTPDPPTPGGSSWTNGTDEQVAALLDAAAAGTIDLQEDAGWRVGDVRTIRLSAFTGGGNTAYAAQDVHIVISSFAEYMSCGNVLQFDFADYLNTFQRINPNWNDAGGYGASEMYTATLPAMVEALPAWLKLRLKTFSVLASEGDPNYSTIETVTGNKLALRSEVEVTGTTEHSNPGEGSQIPYYNTVSHRIKTFADGTQYPGQYNGWWERSSTKRNYSFCYISGDGGAYSHFADQPLGLAPFGCLGGAPVLPGPSVSFTSGSDADVAAAIDAAQAGTINLQNGENAWHTGDKRRIHIDGFSVNNEYVNDQPAEDAYIVITSFDEYMGCGNVLQFDFEDCLSVAQKIDETPWTEGGYGAMLIKQVTLPALVEAMPSWIKTRLKTFTVLSGAGVPNMQEITRVDGNKLALRSEVELFRVASVSAEGEGSYVPYYDSARKRTKRYGINGQYAGWWVRSPYAIQEVSTGSMWDLVSSDGVYCARQNMTFDFGISPFGCL